MKLRYLLAFLPALSLLAQSRPDLIVSSLTSAINTDPQSLAASGSVSATVRNIGLAPTSTGFQLLAFEDRNRNARYDAAVDNVLGTVNVPASLANGASVNALIPISGVLSFRGNIVYATADFNNVITESDESNNARHTGQTSVFVPPASNALNPVVKWIRDSFTDLPTARSVFNSPTVGDVNGDGTPDVVFSSFAAGNRGVIRVVSGDTGNVLFTVTDPDLEVNPGATVTLADIDRDGRPELITFDRSARLMALEHDGTLKWRSPQTQTATYGNIVVADLDRNGSLEIIVGNAVYAAATGVRTWLGAGAAGLGFGAAMSMSAVADLDLDGNLEVIAGPTAYRADGSIYWNRLNNPSSLVDGSVAIGNFDDDPYPEIVIRPYNQPFLYLLEHDGTTKWSVNHSIHQDWGGPPTVGDVDGDGQPEIGIVDRFRYILYEADGSIKWSIPIFETTSGVTSSTFFDFNNDGSSEIVYADQQKFYILRGSDGAILNEFPHVSSTAAEYPVVADVDGDGHADIVVPADVNFGPGTAPGIRVYTGAANNWANTRRVWNQHGYSVTNINDDLSVPSPVAPNWLSPGLNNYRATGFLSSSPLQPTSAPDLIPSLLRKIDTNFPASVELVARIGNGGSFTAPIHRVEFRNGPGGPLLGAANTTLPLAPGDYEDIRILWLNPPSGQFNLVVTVDTNFTVVEGDESNNQAAAQLVIGQGPFVTVDDLIPRAKEGGVDLKWTPIPGAVSYNIYRRVGSGALTLLRAGLITSTGAFSDQPLPNNTTHTYLVRWLNAQGVESQPGTESSATPTPRAQRGNTWPTISSVPPTRGRTESAYRYAPTATDPDAADVVRFSLTGAPSGMNFNPNTGLIEWTPGPGQGGSYRLTLTASDILNHQSTQSFTLFIETQIVNQPPTILSSALTSAAVGRSYLYNVRASDPDAGTILTYLLDTAPTGMTINSSTGLIQWIPTAPGTYPVVLRVRDLAGATATQIFSINVQNPNRGPQITSNPGLNGNAGQTYSYSPTATDPDPGDTLTWSLTQAPTGMSINSATGVILFTPNTSQVASHPVTLEVRDLIGAIAQQSFTLTIGGPVNFNGPPVFTTEPITSGRVNQPFLYDANAVDPENQAVTFSLSVFPAGATIQPNTGVINWTPQPSQLGNANFTVQARDPQNTVSSQTFVVVVAPALDITFQLISPAAGTDLSRPVPIIASITDSSASGPTITWTARLQKPGMPDRQIGSGSGNVANGTIATFDPTIIANDTYTLRVEIFKGADGIARDFPFSVSGDLKMGDFDTSFTDLQIPLAGIPINITRLYSTLDLRSGDFGAGWRIGLFGAVSDAPTETPLRGIKPGDRVYVSTPDGRRVAFRFDPTAPAFLFPFVVTPRFTPDPGVTDKLSVAETSVFLLEGVAYSDFNNVWNPSRYTLTTAQGVRYELDEVNGVQLIRDLSGNTVTFTPTAIVSSQGAQITLDRDGLNRITRIREPGGAEILYTYDLQGNLSTVVNQLGQTSRYFYTNAAFPNYLTRQEDPSGRPLVRTVYGADGRASAICGPDGNVTTLAGCNQFTYDPAAQTRTTFNARGFRADFAFDARGNLLTERRFLDAVNFREILRTYDTANNLLSERDPAGNTVRYTWDTAGNRLSQTDQANRTTAFTYHPTCNTITTVTDPAGGVANISYDAQCRPTFLRSRAGLTTEYRYDSQGNRTHQIDPQGAATIRTFTAQGYASTVRDPRGNTQTLTWSTLGDLQTLIDRNGRRTDFLYDAAHRLTRETWANGRVFQFTYDVNGKLASATDPAASLAFQYDALGRTTRAEATYPAHPLFALDYTYDPNGNRTAAVDMLGANTQRTFDGLDRLTALTQSGTGLNNKRIQLDYDLAGLPVALRRFAALTATSPVANTNMEYDCGGCTSRLSALRHVKSTSGDPIHLMTFARNSLGDILQATDTQGLHSYSYDLARRLTNAVHPNATLQPAEQYTYDAAGNRLSSHLSATYLHSYQSGLGGNLLLQDDQFTYTYDNEGNLTQRRNRTDNSTMNYEYDFRNRLTAIIARNALGVETTRNTFTHDPINRRITSTDAAGDSRFYYDDLNPILSIAPGNVSTRRFYLPKVDAILAEETALQTRWLLTDQVGTVRSIIDNSATVLSNLLTDSFGQPLQNTNPAVTSQLAFNGRESIALSGDMDFRFRTYAPRLGRFLQEDRLSPFAYDHALGSPLLYTDPLGLEATERGILQNSVVRGFAKGVCIIGLLTVFNLSPLAPELVGPVETGLTIVLDAITRKDQAKGAAEELCKRIP